jgi:hypothetical protein
MKGARNAKPKWYNGVLYKSGTEASFAETFDKYGIKFEYEKRSFELLPTIRYNGETLQVQSYTPDFFLENNIIVEAKGYADIKWPFRKKLFIMKYILNNNYEYEFYEIHSVSQLVKFIEELKARNGERLEPEKLNLGGRRTKKKKKRK